MRLFVIAAMATVLAACGATQKPKGEVFCESYETEYMAACRQTCESDLEIGDEPGIQRCIEQCAGDLAGDDNYEESCPGRKVNTG